jgi:hypothetical protein
MTSLLETYLAKPTSMIVDGLPVRFLGDIYETHEAEYLSMLSYARSEYETCRELWGRFSEALPERYLDRRGRPTRTARRVIRAFAEEAAEDFGRAGFCGDPSLWAAWLMEEHVFLGEALRQAARRRERPSSKRGRRTR